MYLNTETNEYPVTEYQIRQRYTNTSFPVDFVPPAPWVKVNTSPIPEYNVRTHKLEEATPIEVDGVYTQQWVVTELTPAEAEQVRKSLTPYAVTMRQARLALHLQGKLTIVEEALDNLEEPEKTTAKIAWEYSQEVQRNNAFVTGLTSVLGMSEADMDELFIFAATL